jgi:hypothetical protein
MVPMALLMKTSRAQVDRLLDPDNGSATIESLQRAARIVGRELRLQLVQDYRRRRRRFWFAKTFHNPGLWKDGSTQVD